MIVWSYAFFRNRLFSIATKWGRKWHCKQSKNPKYNSNSTHLLPVSFFKSSSRVLLSWSSFTGLETSEQVNVNDQVHRLLDCKQTRRMNNEVALFCLLLRNKAKTCTPTKKSYSSYSL